MTQRERPSPENGSVAGTANRPDRALPGLAQAQETGDVSLSPVQNTATRPLCPLVLTTSCGNSLWEQWYEQASPAQRQQALAQASAQGLLFLQHLPTPEGLPPSRRSLLTALLHGPAPVLEPLRARTLPSLDPSLDESQRQAVARALGSSDLSLILGYPGTGKSRVIAEVLRQSAQAGQRVLFLAPTPAAVDRALEYLGGEQGLGILRCLCGEAVSSLPGRISAFTREQRLTVFDEQTLPAAQRAVAAASTAVETLRRDETIWQQLDNCLRQQEQLHSRAAALEKERSGLALLEDEFQGSGESSLRSDWEAIQEAARQEAARIDARMAEVRAEADRLSAEQKQRDEERQQLAPLAEAKQGQRWWTGAFWRATLQGSRLQRLTQLQEEAQQADDRLQTLQALARELEAAREAGATQLQQQRKELLEKERSRREADIQAQQETLGRQSVEAKQAWQGLFSRSILGTPATAEPAREALEAARKEWLARLEAAEQDLALRQQWLDALQMVRPGLPAQLAASARIVAAPLGALTGEAGNSFALGQFDLLVIDEAQRLSDAELLAVSRRAPRWLLVGEMPAELPVPAPPPRRNRPGSSYVQVQPRPAFQRLWCQLHTDPRRLPVRWRLAEGRLVAGLRPVAPEQERWVSDEPVFDRPEISLRIVAPPGQEPQIAEVVFPPATPVEQAKEFIYRELEELSIQAGGPVFCWHECDRNVTLDLGINAAQSNSAPSICLEEGVRELVALLPRGTGESTLPWRTCGLAFSRTAGWDRERAERWVADRLGLRDCGRTTVLASSYRARAPLARFLSNLLYGGMTADCPASPCATNVGAECAERAAVQFVPVPPLGHGETWRTEEAVPGRGWEGAGRDGRPGQHTHPTPDSSGGGTATMTPRTRTARGGAGLEIDLADSRRAETLPADLRAVLPGQGVVNLIEARAVVGMLEGMAGDLVSGGCGCAANGTAPGSEVGVISLFPAQVELLRLLIQRSPVLAELRDSIEVGMPSAFHQREAGVVLLGLTRSHLSRAVPFSDTPQGLLLALTRPTTRLVIFGDPGTMVRRSQWHGGLDHLDELAGSLEQALITRLLNHSGELDHPEIRSREGSSV